MGGLQLLDRDAKDAASAHGADASNRHGRREQPVGSVVPCTASTAWPPPSPKSARASQARSSSAPTPAAIAHSASADGQPAFCGVVDAGGVAAPPRPGSG